MLTDDLTWYRPASLDAVRTALMAGHHAIVVVGAGESTEYLRLAESAAKALSGRGADVIHRVTPNQVDHALPMDFRGQFPGWVDLALGRGAAPPSTP